MAGFWNSALCCQRNPSPCPPRRPVSRTLSPQRANRSGETEGLPRRHPSAHSDSAPPTLRSPVPSQLERRHSSSGPLCIVSPLFLQTRRYRHPEAETRPYAGRLGDSTEEVVKDPVTTQDSGEAGEREANGAEPNSCKHRLPPPRPPPPRSMPHRRPAPPPPGPPAAASARPKSMPESVVVSVKPPSTKRPAPARPSMGTKNGSPPKTTSSPIGVPANPPPPRPKKLDLESHRCHLAMDDDTIAQALSRAKLQPAAPAEAPPDDSALSVPKARGRERLSDMSMSTSSSDSMEYSQSPGFSLGLAASPPRHLRHHHQDAVEDSSDEDGEEDEEEYEDYGVGLETDLEMRLRPSFKLRRRKVGVSLGGGSFILPRALKGRFRKVSGMLSSLVTPERRAVKRISELSRDKSSYFGSLVQDYISFVQENRGCHTSGMDFLQTLRQFLTQMKAYLRQSSELDPPLESLIPEDQIGKSKCFSKCQPSLSPGLSVLGIGSTG